MASAALSGEWREDILAVDGIEHKVLSRGDGPPVIVLHELLGAGPELFAFADGIRRAGYRVSVPILYGRPGQDLGLPSALLRARFCLWGELHLFATGRTSPLVSWLRILARRISDVEQSDVAIVGMCLTGGLVLGTLAESNVAAAVAAQPSMPCVIPLPRLRERTAASLGMSPVDVARAAATTTPVMLLRYSHDRLSPAARTERVIAKLGQQPCAESVTDDLRVRTCGRVTAVEVPGERHATLTYAATDAAVTAVMTFLRTHLRPRPA